MLKNPKKVFVTKTTYYIPITIIDGYGEIILEGVSINQVEINIIDVAVENTFYESNNKNLAIVSLEEANK